MKQKRNKRLALLVASIICAVCAVAGVGALQRSRGHHLEITVTDSAGEKQLIYSETKREYHPVKIDGKGLTLEIARAASKSTSANVRLEQEGRTVLEKEISITRGKASLKLDGCAEGEYDLNITVQEKEGLHAYVSTAQAFYGMAAAEGEAGRVVTQLSDLTLGEEQLGGQQFTVTSPFVWETKGYSFTTEGPIYFVSDTKGMMEIDNESEGDIASGNIFCETPEWDYQISILFGNFKETAYYYINAEQINNRKIDNKTLVIDAPQKAQRLLEGNVMQLPGQVEKLEFKGEYKLLAFTLEKLVDLKFSGSVDVNKKIVVETADAGTLAVDTSGNQVDLSAKIRIEAPQAKIVWEGESAPDEAYVEQYMNIVSFNGEPQNPYIGGTGSCRLKKAVVAGHKAKLQGSYAVITDSYNHPVSMEDAKIKTELEGEGTCTLEEHEGEYYLVVADAGRDTRGYKVYVDDLEHTLPVIWLTTKRGKDVTSKEEYISGRFSIDYNGNGDYGAVENAPIHIRGRGNSTWLLDKKPYKIKFKSKTSLFGLTKAKKWVLLANQLDRTLVRNTVAFSMAGKLDNILFVPSSYPVDVFLNGEYQGVYTLSEQIEVKEGRIEGERDSTEVDTDYLLEIGGDGRNKFGTELCRSVEIKSPGEDVLMLDQLDYVNDYVLRADEAVRNLEGYDEYIDIASLIDWFLLNEFAYNVDGTFRRSDYLLKKKGGKIYMAAPWDFDYAFGNFSMDSENYQEWICNGNAVTDAYKGKYIRENWLQYLLKDPSFTSRLKARWEEVGKDMYDAAMSTIDENVELMGNSVDENFTRWDNLFGTKLQYEKRATLELSSYEAHVEYLRDFIEKRYQWMDETIGKM